MRPRIALYKGTVSERPCVHFVRAVYLQSDFNGGLHIVRLWRVPFFFFARTSWNTMFYMRPFNFAF